MNHPRTGPAPREAGIRNARSTGSWLKHVHDLPLTLGSLVILLYLTVPLGVVLGRTLPTSLFFDYLTKPIVTEALRISLITSSIVILLCILLGTPAAYLLARRQFRGKAIVETLVDLPVVLPPAVAGVALLLTLGRRGIIGQYLSSVGIEIAFTIAAVVLAQLFVAAPYYIRSARGGFSLVGGEVEEAARIDGAGPFATFLRITLPLSMPAVFGGIVLAWAKALGEFGATIIFAGSFLGRTQTLSLAVYQALESDLNAALVVGTILILLSFVVIVTVRGVAGTLGVLQ